MFTIHAMVGKRRNQINMPWLDAYELHADCIFIQIMVGRELPQAKEALMFETPKV